MLPVLWATVVPGAVPAGMASLNFWRFSTSIISPSDAALTALPVASFSNRISSPRAVVSLLSPFSKALLSSTPRSTFMPSAPSRFTVAFTFSTPTRSIRRFAAKLLLTVIIASFNARRLIVFPAFAYTTLSESSPSLSLYGLPSTMLRNSLRIVSGSSSVSIPASAWRNSSIITGTFMVLAA